MPMLEIEVTEKGEIGKLPDPIQKFLDDRINAAFGKGAEKAAKEAQQQIEEAVKRARDEERAAILKAGGDPAAAEKAKNLELELSKMREAEAERAKNYDVAKSEIEKRHAAEKAELEKKLTDELGLTKAEIEKRDGRLRSLVRTEIQTEAIKVGARDTSLDEIGELLAPFVGLDADLLPMVDAELFRKRFPESKLGEDGKSVSIEGLVQAYLVLKPHHKAAPGGRGGRATGGQSLSGHAQTAEQAARDAALQAVAERPTVDNIAKAFGAMKKRAS